ncbi:histidine kinase [Porifericola rhodea]|uniref:sensor histidine kinase n=1 Tax=Porifericola rhodea TaxID=930972 RepID=UPI0026652170|nr:ATP-binding protein [Porifericola rhodea]WKN30838.1 histidine kinase [Porifericola rhodea]
MQAIPGEVQIVIGATVFLLLITAFIVGFIFVHQRQYHKYLQEKEELKNLYKQEILKAQLEIKEQTLNTLSQEIHDNIGQVLSLAKLNLSTLQRHTDKYTLEKVRHTKELIGKSIQDLRNLSKSMNSEYILNQELSHALQKELDMINKTGMYATELKLSGTEVPISPQKKLILFRISQEILNNAIKHSQAKTIAINIGYSTDGLNLGFQDDGKGLDMAMLSRSSGTGLGNIIHRAKVIGATAQFDSQPLKGTQIQISLPTEAYESI